MSYWDYDYHSLFAGDPTLKKRKRVTTKEKKAEEMRVNTSASTGQQTMSQVQKTSSETTKLSTPGERMVAIEKRLEPDKVTLPSVNISAAPNIAPPSLVQQPKYVVGQIVTDKTGEEVQITAIHNDTNKDGREKQTSEGQIFGEPRERFNNVNSSMNKEMFEKSSNNSIVHMAAPSTLRITQKESHSDQVVNTAMNLPVSKDSRGSIEKRYSFIQEIGKQLNVLTNQLKADELEMQRRGSENEELKNKLNEALEQNHALLEQNQALKAKNEEFRSRNIRSLQLLVKQNQALKAENEEFRSRNERSLQLLDGLKSKRNEFNRKNDEIMQQMKDSLLQNKSISNGIH